MSRPIAVLISDIHFTPATLELASSSLRMAMEEAEALHVPLVIAGDTLDSKAIIRGECANRLISLLDCYDGQVIMLVGNHDMLNEKGSAHSLNFLRPYAEIIEHPTFNKELQSYLIPYQTSPEALGDLLKDIPEASRIIMHQGVQEAYMGHYVQDKTSLPKEVFAKYRVISGHYHRAQNIRTGRPRKGGVGLFSYIGNPYSLSFGEAHDGPKGFQVLYDDGLIEQVPTNLRKHVIFDVLFTDMDNWTIAAEAQDLVWIKVRGTKSQLDTLDKSVLGMKMLGHTNFKLDKITTDTVDINPPSKNASDEDLLDGLIDSTNETTDRKAYLKKLWRDVLP